MFGKLASIFSYYTFYCTNNDRAKQQNVNTIISQNKCQGKEISCLKNIWFLSWIIDSNQRYARLVGSNTIDARRKLMFGPKFETKFETKFKTEVETEVETEIETEIETKFRTKFETKTDNVQFPF